MRITDEEWERLLSGMVAWRESLDPPAPEPEPEPTPEPEPEPEPEPAPQ